MPGSFRGLGVLTAAVLVGLLFSLSGSAFDASNGAATHFSTGASAPTPPASVSHGGQSALASAPSPVAKSTIAASILAALKARQVPMNAVYLPNFNSRAPTTGGMVSPLYAISPAPMGVGDFGIQNISGKNTGIVLNTPSVEGISNFTGLNALYIDSTSPDYLSIQLNAVLNHVTLFGKSTYDFWNQNVVLYATQSHSLIFLDNIWNFSSPAFDMTANSLFSYNGTLVAPIFYYHFGPTLTVRTPFSLQLFVNSSVVSNHPAVFFNYSVSSSAGTFVGSYDRVLFNSSVSTPVPAPYYQINGKTVTPTGYLLSDAELVVGGPGGGSTVSLTNINGTMQLFTYNSTLKTYQAVGSAFGYGTDTGETSEGIAEWWSPVASTPTAHLTTGPAFLNHLWGLNNTRSGYIGLNVTLTPANAFVFGSLGTSYLAAESAWAPTAASGVDRFQLYPGTYTFRFMLSDYIAQSYLVNRTVGPPAAVSLTPSPTEGVYTPLWANGNAQLAAISSPGGAGTVSKPYVLLNNQNGSIDSSFGELNDFLFPVFPGVFLNGTSAYVALNKSASFFIAYPSSVTSGLLAQALPVYNYLQFQFYNSAHVSLWGAPLIAGWFSSFQNGFVLGSVMFWNSSNDLVGRSSFQDMGGSLVVYGGVTTTVWNNSFAVAVPNSASSANLYQTNAQVGVVSGGSGYLVFNNKFTVPVPATMLKFDLYSGVPAVYTDTWNVSMRPASSAMVVNGYTLKGNVLGLNYQGGNFWGNYGLPGNPYGTLPYTDSGALYNGGDFLPLVPFALYPVTFTESGLPSATVWNVTFNGLTRSTSGTSLGFVDPNGSYPFVVGRITGYPASPSSGVLQIAGAPFTQPIVFGTPKGTYLVTFSESGLGSGVAWNVTLNGVTGTTYAGSQTFVESNGSYPFSVSAPAYTASPASGTVHVLGAPVTQSEAFSQASGTLTGSVTPSAAAVTVDGSAVTVSGGSFTITLAPGVHAIEAQATGYYPYFNNVSVSSGKTTSLTIALDLQPTGPPAAVGTLAGTVTPAGASVTVNGTAVTVTSGSFRVQLHPGVYAIVASLAGDYTYFNNVTVISGQTTQLTIHLNPLGPTTSASTSAFTSPLFYGLVIAGVLIAAGLIVAALLPRKPKGPAPVPPSGTLEPPGASASETPEPPGPLTPGSPPR